MFSSGPGRLCNTEAIASRQPPPVVSSSLLGIWLDPEATRDSDSPIPAPWSQAPHWGRDRKHSALRVCQKQPAGESIDRKNSYLTATAMNGRWVQQDAFLPYRVEVRLSHSATLCNPLQPYPPLDDHPPYRLTYLEHYCVRTNSPC